MRYEWQVWEHDPTWPDGSARPIVCERMSEGQARELMKVARATRPATCTIKLQRVAITTGPAEDIEETTGMIER